MNKIEKRKQDGEEVTIRKAKWKLCLGILLALAGFAALLAGALLDVQDAGEIALVIAGFFVCDLAGIILLIKAMPGLALSDINKIDKKYGGCELAQLHGMKKSEVEQTLRSHKFQLDDSGYYRRKKFSFLRDSVSYYVKILDSSNLRATIHNEWKRFDQYVQNGKNSCLILMMYSDEPSAQNAQVLRNVGTRQIADNMVLDMYSLTTMVAVGADPVTGVGCYLDIGRGHHLYLYKYGCKMLKKLFG